MSSFDICIVGGGAAGMAAAIEAARTDSTLRILLLEKLPRVGKKLLATGNGRCNLGHSPIARIHYHGSVDPTPAFDQFGDTEAFFHSLGLFTVTDEAGRVYPRSFQATAVVDALRFGLESLGVTVWCDQAVTGIKPKQGGFSIQTTTEKIFAKQVIWTVGGKAAPAFGTDGQSFFLLASLGHQPTTLIPALCALPAKVPKAWKGLRAQARCTAYHGDNLLKVEDGEVQFTADTLSGICVFNLARHCPDAIVLDFFPDQSIEDVATCLFHAASARAHIAVEHWFTGLLSKQIAVELTRKVLRLPLDRPAGLPRHKQCIEMATLLKSWRFMVLGVGDFQKAQVTAGGIPADQITKTYQSTKYAGLYFAGEVLDVDGDCGGYNLHFAWSSGRLVGAQSVAPTSHLLRSSINEEYI